MPLDPKPNRKLYWTGWALAAPVVGIFLFTAYIKAGWNPKMIEEIARLGIPLYLRATLIVLELVCLILYLIPATSVIGAILITGYMGGAIFAHWRVGDNVYLETLLPVIAWLSLYLRDPRLQALFPFTWPKG